VNEQLPDVIVLGMNPVERLGPVKLFTQLTGQDSVAAQVMALSKVTCVIAKQS